MNILIFPSDGIGPEIAAESIAILDAADRRVSLNLRYIWRDKASAHGTLRSMCWR